MVIVTEALLYASFSLLMGGLIVFSLPPGQTPPVAIPKKWLLACVVFIAILSFAPVSRIVFFLYEEIGFFQTLYYVIFTFKIGKAWLVTLIIAILLFCFIYYNSLERDRLLSQMGLFLTVILVFALSWASHSATLTDVIGFTAHAVHFIAVCIWGGLMLVVGWFSTSNDHWLTFVRWFMPLAIGCVSLIIGAGLVMMQYIVPDYVYAWLVPYGQALLIKHLLIIPLVTYAFINGFLMKHRLKKNASFSPKKWLRVESIILLFVFSATAFMGQQSPPHDVYNLINTAGASEWFLAFYQSSFDPKATVDVALHFDTISFLFFVLGFLFLGLILLSWLKNAPSYLSLLMAILVVISGYVGLMVSVQ